MVPRERVLRHGRGARCAGGGGKYGQGSLGGVAEAGKEVRQELSFTQLRALAPTLRANQDDAGHALTFYSLHMPPYVDGFFRSR
jgi:hypothetical protein